jgi:hypothetical protein
LSTKTGMSFAARLFVHPQTRNALTQENPDFSGRAVASLASAAPTILWIMWFYVIVGVVVVALAAVAYVFYRGYNKIKPKPIAGESDDGAV